ncbi:hypothetical protein BKA83DRAFT_110335 [Pisolithus microcarpus]|nr:hypothetical protein BKA83DRAFT_110335 [Pisolithus microcarpus]
MDEGRNNNDVSESDLDEGHEPDAEKPSALKPYHTFATPMTTFHLATKPLAWLTLDEAATAYQLPDLKGAIATFLANEDTCLQGQEHDVSKLQVWHKVHVQQLLYHNKSLLPPQTLHAILPSTTNFYGRYNSVIISLHTQSDWPQGGLVGHSVPQLQMIFCIPRLDLFLTYVQHFNIIPQPSPTNVSPVTGMHTLKQAVRRNGQHIGEVIPLTRIRSLAHLVPNFRHTAHSHLMSSSSYELSNEFWLNKYISKEFYYALSLTYM